MDVDAITMDLNALTFEERNDLYKKGLCFKCKKPGIARECPNHGPQNYGNFNNRNFNHAPAQRNDNRAFVPCNNNQRNIHDMIKKPGPQEINKMIQALTTEERNEMFDLAEKDDVEKGPSEWDFS